MWVWIPSLPLTLVGKLSHSSESCFTDESATRPHSQRAAVGSQGHRLHRSTRNMPRKTHHPLPGVSTRMGLHRCNPNSRPIHSLLPEEGVGLALEVSSGWRTGCSSAPSLLRSQSQLSTGSPHSRHLLQALNAQAQAWSSGRRGLHCGWGGSFRGGLPSDASGLHVLD